ncbi:hypothetical protein SARC_07188 [Sphaeroforma arctica JP610]|uniref:N-acetyltransferase domain-containing protein n=1 Tax=Sphaeroforma arctica JP610 TaxID=667725 RepID=A0A0L0FV64_9EUKA|nr:hypothetical protein SARC_07188 [Sphaeroforma arctica JP610]KNC80451.1 hypothetical protein SARC_07188 [Sphaeroforma arctica JP610]|eukprot:XP_014154353.1 hypothetical protein SARC_07188 [Sphaeroforma arctica JP610]
MTMITGMSADDDVSPCSPVRVEELVENYDIEWSCKTQGRDEHLGGWDFKRTDITGKLLFRDDESAEGEHVGSIFVTRINRTYICNEVLAFDDVLDETVEMNMIVAFLEKIKEEGEEDSSGNCIFVQHLYVSPRHRGYGLGWFMVQACDEVFNSGMSLAVLMAYPQQYNHRLQLCHERFLPGANASLAEDYSQFDDGRNEYVEQAEKLTMYFEAFGFTDRGDGMLARWNGERHPSLHGLMGRKIAASEKCRRRPSIEDAIR